MTFFHDKVIWITGASSGIGEALAKQLSAEGARLILSARRTEELERVRDACINREQVFILPLDLADTDNISASTEKAVARFGTIDVLINNGGISQRSWAKDTPLSVDRKIMEVNFFGTVALSKSVLPHMLRQKSGHIVVISSIAGKFGFYLRSAYSASKHALHGFFESLRMEVYRENIHVTLVCPGKIKTNISFNAITEEGKKNNKPDRNEEKRMPAGQCAARIIRAIKKRQEEVFIGGSELNAVWIKRLFPQLFSRLIRKQGPA